MKKKIDSERLVVALDIGTTKICVIAAQIIDEKSMEVIAIGQSEALGIARGIIMDITKAVSSIKKAIKEAELMAGCKITSATIGISGAHIQAMISNGMIPIKKERVRSIDVATVIAATRAVVIPEGQQVLHVLPQYFVIDGQQKLLDPVGMFGVRLEAKTHIITGSVASVQNLVRCCQLAGLDVNDIVLEPLASANSVFGEDEKHLGAGLLDIGGGTSDFAIYQQGTIRYTKIFPIAGNHVTNDIALCLRSTLKDAERIKKEFGITIFDSEMQNLECEIEMVQGFDKKRIKIRNLIAIIEPRIVELLNMVKQEIDKNYLTQYMPTGLVLTGGGSLLKGIEKTAQSVLNMPVRVGKPCVPEEFKDALESPVYATGYGLLLYSLKRDRKKLQDQFTGPMMTRILWRMKSWIADFF